VTFLPLPRRTPEAEPQRPERVAGADVIGATAASGAATLFTAPYDGMYRVSGVLECTTGGDAISLTLSAISTDSVGTPTQQVCQIASMAGTGRANGRIEVWARRGTAIQWQTTLGGVRLAAVWNVHVAVERM
jgi:hypothetical protein